MAASTRIASIRSRSRSGRFIEEHLVFFDALAEHRPPELERVDDKLNRAAEARFEALLDIEQVAETDPVPALEPNAHIACRSRLAAGVGPK